MKFSITPDVFHSVDSLKLKKEFLKDSVTVSFTAIYGEGLKFY